MKKLFFSN